MNKLYFATTNKGKIQEFKYILNIPIVPIDLEIDEVQSMDLEYIARKKVEAAFNKLKKPVIIDDVGLFVDAWRGLPGPFIKHFFEELSYQGAFELFDKGKNKKVHAVAAIAYHDGKEAHVFMGEFTGKIAFPGRGKKGFGFDPFIIPDGYNQTFAEMDEALKNKISHRARALKKFKKFLDSQNTQNAI